MIHRCMVYFNATYVYDSKLFQEIHGKRLKLQAPHLQIDHPNFVFFINLVILAFIDSNTSFIWYSLGHTGKVFGVKWSPYKDGLIATSSDDR